MRANTPEAMRRSCRSFGSTAGNRASHLQHRCMLVPTDRRHVPHIQVGLFSVRFSSSRRRHFCGFAQRRLHPRQQEISDRQHHQHESVDQEPAISIELIKSDDLLCTVRTEHVLDLPCSMQRRAVVHTKKILTYEVSQEKLPPQSPVLASSPEAVRLASGRGKFTSYVGLVITNLLSVRDLRDKHHTGHSHS